MDLYANIVSMLMRHRSASGRLVNHLGNENNTNHKYVLCMYCVLCSYRRVGPRGR